MNLIDIHSHLQFYQFDADRAVVIKRVKEAKMGVINVGTDLETSRQAVALARANDEMWATVGIHPTDLPSTESEAEIFAELEKLARDEKTVGIGECGLDSLKLKTQNEKEQQKEKNKQGEIFKKQIELALVLDKPLMIHCRNAYDEVLEIFDVYFKIHKNKLRGNIHFFAGDWAIAQKFLALGFTLSFTGVITFTHDYDEVIQKMPLGQLLVETDCPFVAPVPYRGKRNEPIYVMEVIKRIAELRGLTVEAVVTTTLANARREFAL